MGENNSSMASLHKENTPVEGTSVDNHGHGLDDIIMDTCDSIDNKETDPSDAGPDDIIWDTRDISLSIDNKETDPGDPDSGNASGGVAGGGTTGGSPKYAALLCSVSFLMLAVAAAMTVLYVLKDQSYTQVQKENGVLQSNLSRTLNKVDGLSKEVTALNCEIKKIDEGWTNFSGKWYYFFNDVKNWTESRNDCITLGGDLATVKSAEENDFILAHGDKWWVGVTDSVEEGTWLWVDNTPFLQEGVLWAYKQPDNYIGTGGDPEGEDCGLLEPNGMNDVICTKPFKSTCESHCRF